MAMLSLTPPKPTISNFPSQHHHNPLLRHRRLPSNRTQNLLRPISATKLPSRPPPAPPGEVYQPFRPPPSPLPAKYRSLGPAERLEILRDRLGLWHEYAPIITSLSQDGFTPPSIEEVSGISGVEQNRLIVATQVRDSLVSSSFDPEQLSYFDSSGSADLLYEIRLLNAAQRAAAARHIVDHRLDAKAAQDLARAVKDFARRRGDDGWDKFTAASPGDCLAYTHFRLSREAISPADRLAALEKALEVVETEGARRRIEEERQKASGGGIGGKEGEAGVVSITVPVVRLRYGEVAEATSVVLLPVCRATEGEAGLGAAPGWCRAEGEVGVVAAEKGWSRWVVMPGWGPVADIGEEGAVAVEFGDARVLPWRVNRQEKEEAILVVVDRKRREVEEDEGFYLVGGEDLGVERGKKLSEKGVRMSEGKVVLVMRPPKEEEEDQLGDEDWV